MYIKIYEISTAVSFKTRVNLTDLNEFSPTIVHIYITV